MKTGPRVITLDGRYNLSQYFRYRLEWNRSWHGRHDDNINDYQKVRRWLTENFGHGCEETYWTKIQDPQCEWAFGVGDRLCFYVNDKILTAWVLYKDVLLPKKN
jgi:hypothetical protein